MTGSSPKVLVVGGGISGLVAAYRLRQRLGADARIVLADGAERLGGKLRTVDLAGEPVDVGAEAFIARRPELPALLGELGLSDQLVYPAGLRPLIWSEAALHPLPADTLMGIPADGNSLRGHVDDRDRGQVLLALRRRHHLIGAIEGGEVQKRGRAGRHQETHQADPLSGGVGGLDPQHHRRAAV